MVNGRRESPFTIFYLPLTEDETRSIPAGEPARAAAHNRAGVVRGRRRHGQRRGGPLLAQRARGRRVVHTTPGTSPHGTRTLAPSDQTGLARRRALPLRSSQRHQPERGTVNAERRT